MTTEVPVQAWRRSSLNCLGNNPDRFIPFRRHLNFESAYGHLGTSESADSEDGSSCLTPDNQNFELRAYRKRLSLALNQNPLQRVLSFSASSPASPTPQSLPPASYPFNLTHTFQFLDCEHSPAQLRRRELPRDPYKILALPDLRDDFYCNTMDWGSQNVLALALGNDTFLWNAGTNTTQSLTQPQYSSLGSENQNDTAQECYVSSVRWSKNSQTLALGRSGGTIELWDIGNERVESRSHGLTTKQIGCMEWQNKLLYCGSRDGCIHVLDTREPRGRQFVLFAKRKFEFTSLQLSPDETILASGSDDGFVRLWCTRTHALLLEIDAHMSSIKALAWCPWKSSVFASGGGCNDGRIVLWNRNRGEAISERDTKTQTCALVWSPEYKELVSSHGYPTNSISLWSVKNFDLKQENIFTTKSHQGRVLHLALSPDKTTLASAAADETLCLWKLFPGQKHKEAQRSPVDLFGLR